MVVSSADSLDQNGQEGEKPTMAGDNRKATPAAKGGPGEQRTVDPPKYKPVDPPTEAEKLQAGELLSTLGKGKR